MVFVNDKKYACETCIKGHRSSTCNHTDRPLFEIKKKGRPATQCEHCRELRKTKQVHIKCVCEGREDAERQTVTYSIPAKKANRKGVQASAAFPHGLSDLVGESASSDAMVDRKTEIPCTCTAGGECRCFSPRRAANARRASDGTLPSNKVPSSLKYEAEGAVTEDDLHSSMRYAQQPSTMNSEGLISSSSDTFQYQTSYDNSQKFSGYSQNTYNDDIAASTVNGSLDGPVPSPIASMNGSLHSSPLDSYPPDSGVDWMMNQEVSNSIFQPLCECGNNCRCPGCMQHGDPSSLGQYMTPAESCVNPNNCVACLNCIFLNPTSQYNDGTTAQASQQSSTYQLSESVDDWLRQVMAESPSSLSSPTGSNTLESNLTTSSSDAELWELLNGSGAFAGNANFYSQQSLGISNNTYSTQAGQSGNNFTSPQGQDGINFSFHAPTPISPNQLLPNVASSSEMVTSNHSGSSLSVPSTSSVSRSPSSGSQSSAKSAAATASHPSKSRPPVHVRPIAPNGPLPLNRPPPLSPIPPYGRKTSPPRSAGSSTAGRLSMTSVSASSSASGRSVSSVSPDSAAVHEFRNMKM